MPFELRWEDPADESYAWSRYMGGPVTRLYEDVLHVMYRHKRICFEETGVPYSREHIVRVIDGWVFNRPPSDLTGADERLARFQRKAATFPGGYYIKVIRPEVVDLVDGLRKHPRPAAPLPELLAHLEEAIDAHGRIMGDLHWRMVFSGTPLDWPTIFHELTGEPAERAGILLSGTANEVTKLTRRLRALASLAADDDELLAAVSSADLSELRGHPDQPLFQKFWTSFRTLLRHYGLRTGQGWGSAVTMGAPTWNMRPDVPLGMIAAYATADQETLTHREKTASHERQRLLQRIQRGLRSDPERLQRFETARQQAIRNALTMEDHNHWMDSSAAGVMREAADVVGRRLVSDGKLDDPYDVLHMALDELRDQDDVRDEVRARRERFKQQEAFDPPRTIGSGAVEKGESMEAEGQGLDGALLRGVCASAGRYKGRARVVVRSFEPPDVSDGDVLVCIDSGPSWTPIFPLLGAIVLDRGATWQHAAVIAREFGIPAVFGTQEATTAIKDGQTITVDGDAGVVEL